MKAQQVILEHVGFVVISGGLAHFLVGGGGRGRLELPGDVSACRVLSGRLPVPK
jgi:hypothetical protein